MSKQNEPRASETGRRGQPRRGFLKAAAAAAGVAAVDSHLLARGLAPEGSSPVEEAQGSRTRGNPQEGLTVIALVKGVVGKEEQLKAELLTTEAPTRAEPGCITFNLYQSADQKNHFMRYEVWVSKEDFEKHRETAHVKASQARRREKQLTTGPSDVTLWEKVSKD